MVSNTPQNIWQQFTMLKKIIALIPGHVYWSDKNHVFQGCNDEQARSLGLNSSEEFIGKTPYDFKDRAYADKICADNRKVMKTGKAQDIEEAVPQADGTHRYYLTHKVPLFDEEGSIMGVFGISTNITARKRNEIELAEMKQKLEETAEENKRSLAKMTHAITGEKVGHELAPADYAKNISEYLRTIIDQTPGHVYWKDIDGKYLGCNKVLLDSMHLSAQEEIVGLSDEELAIKYHWPEEIAKSFMEEDRKIIDSGIAQYNIESHPIDYFGKKEQYFLSNKVPLYNQAGDIIGLLGISFDITNRKQMEKALKTAKERAESADQLKSDFIANMEHDLRTPAGGIAALTEILAQKEKDPAIKKDLELLSEAGSSLLGFLNQILDFANLVDHHAMPIKHDCFDLKLLLDRVLMMQAPVAVNKDLDFSYTLPRNIPQKLIGDEFRLQRVLLNIISNALKFTEKGYVHVRVVLLHHKKEKVDLVFQVSDTGIGIPEDKKEIIFEKFVRLDPANKGIYPGTGLGLKLVKQFVHDLEGKVVVKNHPQGGTEFLVTLPFVYVGAHIDSGYQAEKTFVFHHSTKTETAVITTVEAQQKDADFEEPTSERILLVEDDLLAGKVALQNIQSQFKGTVDLAKTGQEAMDYVKNHHYRLIFMDIGLPDGNGYDFVAKIREKYSQKELPVVMLTAHSHDAIKAKCFSAGANDFEVKPLMIETVVALIKKYVLPKKEKPSTEKEELLLDQKVLLDLSRGNENLFNEMMKIHFNELTQLKEQCRILYQNQESDELQKILHKLQGSCSYCGTFKLKKAAADLKRVLRESTDEVAPYFEQVMAILASTVAYLDELFQF